MATVPSITYISTATTGGVTASSISLPLPFAPLQDAAGSRYMVAFIAQRSATETVQTPSGWTRVGAAANASGGTETAFYRKIVNGDSATQTFTFSTNTNAHGALYQLSGVHPTSPVNSFETKTGLGSAVTFTTLAAASATSLPLFGASVLVATTSANVSFNTTDAETTQATNPLTHQVGHRATTVTNPQCQFNTSSQYSGVCAVFNPYDPTPTIVQSIEGDTAGAAATSISFTLGAAPTVGNLLLAFIGSRATADPVTVPAGWTFVTAAANASGGSETALYRKVQSGDSATQTFTLTSTVARGTLIEVSGQHPVLPIIGWDSSTTSAAATNWGSNITVVAAPVRYFSGAVKIAALTSAPGGATVEISDSNNAGALPLSHATGYRDLATTGTSGVTGTWSASGSVTGAYVSFAVAGVNPYTPQIVQWKEGNTGGATAASVSVTLDAAPTQNANNTRYLVAFIGQESTTETVTVPTGWTRIGFRSGTGVSITAFYRRIVAGDPAGTTFTFSPTTNSRAAVFELSNVDPSDPINATVAGSAGTITNPLGAVTANAITRPNALTLWGAANNEDRTGTPTGNSRYYTELTDSNNAGSLPFTLTTGARNTVDAPETIGGDVTWSSTGGVSVIYSIAFAPFAPALVELAQVAVEALVTGLPSVQLSQVAVEALVSAQVGIAISQVVLEVLVPNAPTVAGMRLLPSGM